MNDAHDSTDDLGGRGPDVAAAEPSTDTSADATTGIAEFRQSVAQAREQLRALVGADRGTRAQFLGDLVALVPLAAMLVWMSTHDGGAERYYFQVAAGVVLLASPIVLLEAARLHPVVRRLLAAYGVGLVLALAIAGDRNEWVPSILVLTIVPVCGLAAHRVWRRPWGPAALLTIVGLAFGSYWYRSFLAWWGDTLAGRVPLWRPLSWHNQSAMLMGAFGVLGLGVAALGRRYVAGIGVLLAAGGLAGAWLSGSRGALVATALGVVLAIVAAARTAPRRGLLQVGIAALAALATVAALTAMVPAGATISDRSGNFDGDSTNPLTNRATSAASTFRARLLHMEAAIGMFLDDPLTGEGPGSYRRLALEHTPPNANLTSSAHNEYLEVFAEGGLLTGVPFAALHGLIAIAAIAAVWRRREVGEDEVRGPLQVGAALAVVTIGAHSGLDFDWTFPALPVLLATGAAMLARPTVPASSVTTAPMATDIPAPDAGEADGTGPTRRSLAWLAVLPLVLLLGGAVWGAAAERSHADGGEDLTGQEFADLPLGWQGDRLSQHALTLSRREQHELAAGTIQRAIRWSPDVKGYRAVAQIVLYRAEAITAVQLLGRIEEIDPGFGTLNLTAEALIDRGDFDLARALTERTLASYTEFEAQGIEGVRAETWYLRAELEAERGDCAEAAAQIQRAVDGGDIPEAFVAREFGPLVLTCPGIVPGVVVQTG